MQFGHIGMEEVVLDRVQQVPELEQHGMALSRCHPSVPSMCAQPIGLQLAELFADVLQIPLQIGEQPAGTELELRIAAVAAEGAGRKWQGV
jgi:hypothetical protein